MCGGLLWSIHVQFRSSSWKQQLCFLKTETPHFWSSLQLSLRDRPKSWIRCHICRNIFLHNNIDSTNLNCPTFWEQYGYPVNAPEALVARCCYLAIEAMRKTGNFAQKVWLWLIVSFCWLAIGKVKQDLSPDILDKALTTLIHLQIILCPLSKKLPQKIWSMWEQ